jgi:hypothetical protein
MVRCALSVAVLVAVLTPAPGAPADIPVELRFDGRPFEPAAPPDFTCFNATLARWVGCRVRKGEAPGLYALESPEPGTYRMHVSIDENPANPRRYPGDYEAQPRFEVTAEGPERLIVDLPRLIHLTRPGDNSRSLEGMLRGCATQPTFETPRHSWRPVARVELAWEPVVPGAEYRTSVAARPCGGPGAAREILKETTGTTAVAVDLPPSPEGEHYVFRVEAWKDGRLVGDLYTHDGGTHSWNYRFRVVDASLPRWAYPAAGAAAALLLAGVYAALLRGDVGRRRRRARLLAWAAAAALVVGAVGAGVHHYRRDLDHQRAEAERARRHSASGAAARAHRRVRVGGAASRLVGPRRDAVPGR